MDEVERISAEAWAKIVSYFKLDVAPHETEGVDAIQSAIEKATEEKDDALNLILNRCENTRPSQAAFDDIIHWCKSKSRAARASERCPGPRQYGHPLVYESHCDHGETKSHVIQSATTRKYESNRG